MVAQGKVDALLYALDRDSSRCRFSLNRAMQESGSKDIATGKGDLGALLFAGMAGLPRVQDALIRTQNRADGFFRTEGRRSKSIARGAGLAELTRATPSRRPDRSILTVRKARRATGTDSTDVAHRH